MTAFCGHHYVNIGYDTICDHHYVNIVYDTICGHHYVNIGHDTISLTRGENNCHAKHTLKVLLKFPPCFEILNYFVFFCTRNDLS